MNSTIRTVLPLTIVLFYCDWAFAQSLPAADSSLPVIAGTPVPLTSAVVNTVVSDTMIELQIGSQSPTQYRIAKHPVYIGPTGSPVDASMIKPGARIMVHFMEDGSETIIDRIFLQ